jgi:hypothetical protein
MFSLIFLAVGALFALALFFLPTLVARSRSHPNTTAIFLVNLLVGWTFIGWVVALVWACTRPAVVVYAAPPTYIAPPQQWPASPAATPALGPVAGPDAGAGK